MSDEEKQKLEKVIYDNKYLFCDKRDVDFLLNLIEKMQKENGQIRTELDRKNKMLEEVKKAITYDRMEQLDDYVLFFLEKYLEILGE